MPAKRSSAHHAHAARKKAAKPRPHRSAHAARHKISLEEERTLFVKEQTLLSKERTILSFMRTGLGFITAGFAIIAATAILESMFKINPLTSFVIGWGIVAVGFLEIIESFRRLRVYREKMKEITSELGDESV